MMSNQISKSVIHLGIQINGLDLSRSNKSQIVKDLLQNFYVHHLLIIPGQTLTEEQLLDVSTFFGEPVPSLVPTYQLKNYPVITRLSNMKDDNNLPVGVMAPEYVFHSDSYFTSNPSKATLLYSLKSPKYGGETYFADMCYAYDTLDELTKKQIESKKIKYKNAYINRPPVAHPIVRFNPVTNKKALFVNIHRAIGIEGMDQDVALDFIDRLYKHAIRSEFLYKHKWKDGDLLIWNNVTTMHCATTINSSQKRLLYRILTKGDFPVI